MRFNNKEKDEWISSFNFLGVGNFGQNLSSSALNIFMLMAGAFLGFKVLTACFNMFRGLMTYEN